MSDEQEQLPASSPWRLAGLISWITIKWIVYFAIFFALIIGGAATGYVASLVKDEEIRSEELIVDRIGEYSLTGYVYFQDETLVGQLRTEEDRIMISYSDLPKHLIDALLAIEDNNFETHLGVDINGFGRAVKQKLFNEDIQTGGSTLTQQLARRVFLNADQTDSRKFKEIFLSFRIERYLSKDDILTAYLNKMPFGNGSNGYQAFGIMAAAKGIFNIDKLSDLTLAQSAYLTGLPQRPSAYTAFNGRGQFNERGFDLALQRQQLVLKRMLETGRINEQEYKEALAFDIRGSLAQPSEKAYTTYPYLMLEAERQAAMTMLEMNNPDLKKDDPQYAQLLEDERVKLLRGGYHIYTTIDKDVYGIMREVGNNESNFTPYSESKGLEQVAAMAIDHRTGRILGMLEGRDFYVEQMNYATQMTRQPGSTMKTIAAYLPAFEMGLLQPAGIIDDAPIVMKDGQKGYHIPMNVNRKFAGLVTARAALNSSMNLPALKIFNDLVTVEKAWDFVKELGITTLQPSDAEARTGVIGGLSIGVTVEELTNAYGAIPNGGLFNDAYMIEKIVDAKGKVVYEHKSEAKRVFSEQTAFLITDMLRTVISDARGSANSTITRNFKQYGKVPVAGKTGSTQSYGDVWFVGFTPEITLGVWSGYKEQANSLSTEGRKRSMLIWSTIMNELTEHKPDLFAAEKFEQPEGIVKATVSSASGLLPSSLTRSQGMLVTDWFNQKYLPKKTDESVTNMKVITYKGINYIPHEGTPSDMLSERTVVLREKPLDVLMKEIEEAQSKLPAKSRRNMSIYVPADAGKSGPSIVDPRVEDGAAPAPPSSVRAEKVPEGGAVAITFDHSASSDVVGYRVYRSMDQSAFQKVGDSIKYDDNRWAKVYVSETNHYQFYVTAVDVSGNESAPSQLAVYGTSAVEPTPSPTPNGEVPAETPGQSDNSGQENSSSEATVPVAPQNFKGNRWANGVTVSWSASAISEQVTHYNVYFSQDKSNYTLIGTTQDTSFEYIAVDTAGTYYVTAVNSHGESKPSNTLTSAN